jgi:hypothetical protein
MPTLARATPHTRAMTLARAPSSATRARATATRRGATTRETTTMRRDERSNATATTRESDDARRDRTLALTALAACVIASGCADGADAIAAMAGTMADGADNAAAATTTPNELFALAGGEVPFWANMVKYARFSISIMVGFAYMFGRPVAALLKKPQTAAAVVAVGAGGYVFFKFTIETMLGMNDPSTMG